jgi:hypothetical protein
MPQKYFQVIPLYLRDDDAIVHYFNEYKSEIDAVTHGSLEVAALGRLTQPVLGDAMVAAMRPTRLKTTGRSR